MLKFAPTLIPASRKAAIVSGTPSCNLKQIRTNTSNKCDAALVKKKKKEVETK